MKPTRVLRVYRSSAFWLLAVGITSIALGATVPDASAANTPPALDLDGDAGGTGFSGAFTEDGGAVAAVDSLTLTLTDSDDTTMKSARATLTTRPDTTAESLAFGTCTGITVGSYNSGNGRIDLSGVTTTANYQSCLRTLTYNNTSQNPTTTNRTITVFVTDNNNTDSNTATSTISVSAANDAPAIDLNGTGDGTGFSATFTEGGAALAIVGATGAGGLTVADPDDTSIESASATLVNHPDGSAESLAVSGCVAGITVTSYNSTTGVLFLSGPATLANYESCLRSLKYSNTSTNPDPAQRTVNVIVNDGSTNSSTAASLITVNPVNDAPSGANNTVSINEDATYTFAASDFGFTDPNDSPAHSFSAVKITTLPSGTLALSNVPVTAGQTIPVTSIPNLTFTPAANASGTPLTSFTFQVQDSGGTANGGVDLDPTANTFTFNVTAVNDAPAGTNKTITFNEDAAYTFTAADFGFTDANDSPPNTFTAVTITTLPGAGTLTLSNVAVTVGQSIPVASIPNLVFTPAGNASGASYASFTFQVQDNGGTANGGQDLDQSPNTITFNVTAVNDAPAGADKTIGINEDAAYTFSAADFGFTDPNDSPPNTLSAVKITTLPGAGTLTLSNVAVTIGQSIPVASIPNLVFTPAANASGTPYTTFTFQVQDDGGTANGGVNLDPVADTITFNVTAISDAPAGTSGTIPCLVCSPLLEDATYTFVAADFGFSDPNDSPANSFSAVTITTLPGLGSLTLSNVAVTAGQSIPVASIPNLVFTPAANGNGTPYTSFTFQVQDNGGTANGGADLDPTPNTLTFNVTSVNDAPAGTDGARTTNEDTALTFAAANFGFTDPTDQPFPDGLQAVKITTLPAAGTLALSNVAVTTGQSISLANIPNLTFTPAANGNGSPYTTFTFQVQDTGGTVNGGVDLDQSPNTMTINVTSVNDAPAGTNNTVSTNEDTAYTFAAADFGFTDPNDSPPNAFSAVQVTTLPGAGSLTLSNVAVTAGQSIPVASIPNLVFTPAANASGTPYASFTFQVQDDGGTANGGVNLDQSANTMNINVNAANDAPAGADKTIEMIRNTTYTFLVADFGFTDPIDSPPNSLLGVKITTLPGAGTLALNNVAVTAGQIVSATDITAGNLKFTPVTGAFGSPYTSFTFQVQDNGGTANGGVDLDPSANTITINVIPPPTVFVITHVIDDNGQIASANDFTVNVAATNASPNDFPGAEAPGVEVTFSPGSYSVSQTGPTDYVTTFSAGCSGSLNNGQSATCTITNDDLAIDCTVPTIVGTNASETITGTEGDDVIDGLGGNDTIRGLGGRDVICGGDGSEILLDGGGGDDIIWGGPGNDVIRGGPGFDRLIAEQGFDNVEGGDDVDWLLGDSEDDTLRGGLGDDVVLGGDGNDQIFGNENQDVLVGELGNDNINGGAGDDQLYGLEGNDGLNGSTGFDSCFGGDGFDTATACEEVDEVP